MDKKLVFGKYQTIELLGRGGFATVYKARNTILGNEVALKVLDVALATDETFVTRFLQEAQQTVRLDHPNIMRVLDLDRADDKLFIVMEYVPGQNLRDWLKGRSLPLEQVASIVRQIAAALDYAHSRQIVHRDVKPSNIMIRDDGRVKLADFGIAKAAEGARLTLTGTTIGTPAYMSPEQSRGAELDGRSDLYSLGVIAFELITGQVPFQGDTAAVIYKQIHEPPPLPSTVTARAKGSLEPALLKALAKEPANRYQTGKALAEAVGAAVHELQTRPLTEMYDKINALIDRQQFADAIHELEMLEAMHPEYRDAPRLLQQARQGFRLTKQYQRAAEHLRAARALVTEITTIHPQFPDNEQVIQTLQQQPKEVKEVKCDGRAWFWVGATAVFTAYFSTTWQWITGYATYLNANTMNITHLQIEGIGALAIPGAPWVIWPPLICVILAIVSTWLPARPTDDSSGNHPRPPIDRTEVLAVDKPTQKFSPKTAFTRIILLVGFITAVFLIFSVRNLAGPIMIAVGLGVMLLTEIVSFVKK